MSNTYRIKASRSMGLFHIGILLEGIRKRQEYNKFLKDKPWYDFDLGIYLHSPMYLASALAFGKLESRAVFRVIWAILDLVLEE